MLVLGLPHDVGFGTRCTSPVRPAGCRCSTSGFDLTEQYTFWSGHHRRVLPVPVVLRHRPEPGAALPGGEVGRRSALVAVDERLLEDPAPVAGADRRRADVHVLPVHAAADALQPGPRTGGASQRAGRRSIAALEQRFEAAIDARRKAAEAAASMRRGGDAAARAMSKPRFQAADERGQGRPRRSGRRSFATSPATASYNDVNYVFPTFVTTTLPIGPRRPDRRRPSSLPRCRPRRPS